jgi:hypothetical protein
MLHLTLQNDLFKNKNLLNFFRNKKNYFSTTPINIKSPYSPQKLLKKKFNIFKILQPYIVANSSLLRYVKILCRVFFKAFKKQYALAMKRKKFHTKNPKVLQRQQLFLKNTILKKTLLNTEKAFNILILKRTKVAYKHLKAERLKLFVDYSTNQFLLNYP